MQDDGLNEDAEAVDTIGEVTRWSHYATSLIKTAISVAKSKDVLDKLHILLYPKNLGLEHAAELKREKDGIIWL